MHHTQPLPWLGHAVKHVGQPLHVVELQPQRIIKIDVRLIGTADAEREGSRVRQIRHQQCAIRAGTQYQSWPSSRLLPGASRGLRQRQAVVAWCRNNVEGRLAMKLRWIDSNRSERARPGRAAGPAEAHRRIPLARHSGVERRSRGDLVERVSLSSDGDRREPRTATTFPESMCIRTTSFIVVHAPEIGAGGHVHYLELDQFVGEDFLVTVHGPMSPKVPLEAALRETEAVAARMESGRLHPTSPFGLTYAIVSSIARREADMVAEIAREVGLMEQRVMAEVDEDPQKFLSELFAARHELLTIKTMADQGSEIYRRAIKLTTFAPPEGLELMKDVLDQYETVAHISDSQLRVLDGRHRVLPCAYRHQDDHRRRAARRHRGDHPPDHVALVGAWHERHRQRFHPLGSAGHLAVDHADHVVDLAALGPQTGLVVTCRLVRISAGYSRLRV